MKKLIKLEINGFQSPNRSASIDFSNEAVSVIYGENGCGKTTFLKLLHAVLNKDNSILLDESVESIKLEFKNDADEFHTVLVSKIIEKDEDGEVCDIDYDWSELNASDLLDSRSLSLGVERGVTAQASKVEAHDIFRLLNHPRYRNVINRIDVHSFSQDLSRSIRDNQIRKTRSRRDDLSLEKNHTYLQSIKMSNIGDLLADRYRIARSVAAEKIQNALFDTLAMVIEPSEKSTSVIKNVVIPENFDDLVMENKARIIEALNDGFENNFKERVINILKEVDEDSDISWLRENNLFSQLIMNMIKELEVEKQLLSSINTLVETFNEYLTGNKKLVVTTTDVYVEINKHPHNINALSSGERHILTFLSLVVIAGRDRDFLIIDEPEISLNIKWQRSLMSLLQKLVPYTQIIVASHSPLIAKKIPQSLVKLDPQDIIEPKALEGGE